MTEYFDIINKHWGEALKKLHEERAARRKALPDTSAVDESPIEIADDDGADLVLLEHQSLEQAERGIVSETMDVDCGDPAKPSLKEVNDRIARVKQLVSYLVSFFQAMNCRHNSIVDRLYMLLLISFDPCVPSAAAEACSGAKAPGPRGGKLQRVR